MTDTTQGTAGQQRQPADAATPVGRHDDTRDRAEAVEQHDDARQPADAATPVGRHDDTRHRAEAAAPPRPSDDEAAPARQRAESVPPAGQQADDAALALYRELRARGSATAREIVAATGLDAALTALGWRRLHELGLVQVTDGVAEAVDPDAAMVRAMDLYHADAEALLRRGERLQDTTKSLLTVFRPSVAREAAEVEVEYLRDPRRKRRVRTDLDAALGQTVGSLHPGPMPPMSVLAESLEDDRRTVARGIRVRDIYSMAYLQNPRYARYLQDLAAAGVEVRLVDHAPIHMMIFDDLTALLTADLSVPAAMIVVRGAAVVRTYVALYEDFWLRGVPLADALALRQDGGLGITAQERVVVRLMATGLSDEQIARRLGLHRRTVQRAVAKLMERLNANSRFEAGLKLAGGAEFARTFATQ